jgi:hypothetical protein
MATTSDQGKLLHQFKGTNSKSNVLGILMPVVVILLIIISGAATGYFLATGSIGGSSAKMIAGGEKAVSGPDEMGLKDEEQFPDKAQGKIEVKKSDEVAEGSHLLIRPGGEDQTAYLTSSVVDLDQFKGKCVEVWGETFSAQAAGWFMDVGYVKKLSSCPEGL